MSNDNRGFWSRFRSSETIEQDLTENTVTETTNTNTDNYLSTTSQQMRDYYEHERVMRQRENIIRRERERDLYLGVDPYMSGNISPTSDYRTQSYVFRHKNVCEVRLNSSSGVAEILDLKSHQTTIMQEGRFHRYPAEVVAEMYGMLYENESIMKELKENKRKLEICTVTI